MCATWRWYLSWPILPPVYSQPLQDNLATQSLACKMQQFSNVHSEHQSDITVVSLLCLLYSIMCLLFSCFFFIYLANGRRPVALCYMSTTLFEQLTTVYVPT